VAKPSHAEALLAVFTTYEHAASIVGDLLEESSARRRGWFTMHVLRVSAALALGSVVASPLRSLTLAIGGYFIWLLLYVPLFFLLAVPAGLRVYPGDMELMLARAPLGFWFRYVAVVVLASYLTGLVSPYALSPKPGTCAPLAVFWVVAWIAWPWLAVFVYSLSWPWIAAGAVAAPFVYLLPLLAGAAQARRADALSGSSPLPPAG
jgi:hypothetical protein